MISDTSPLGRYHLYPNWTVKTVFFLGIVLQIATLALAVGMLSLGAWMEVNIEATQTGNNKYEYSRIEGLLQDCYQSSQPGLSSGGLFDTANQCYMKDFGQYKTEESTEHQRAIAIAGATLVSIALLGTALDIVAGLHLAFIWFRAPYDSFYIRAYRLCVGFIAALTSCLFLATMVTFHVGLRLSIQKIPYTKLLSTSLDPTNGYYMAWACVGCSVLGAWVIIFSTCFWAMDYVNCRALAAAFHPTCSQRASTLSMTNGIRNSVYSLNNDGVWSLQDPPTLPRYYTSTYGDGSEIRNKIAEMKEEDKSVEMEIKGNSTRKLSTK